MTAADLPGDCATSNAATRASMLQRFVGLALAAVVVFVASVILHNVLSALLGLEEPVFFVIAVILAPVAFAIGVAGAVVTAIARWSRRAQRE